MSVGVVFICLSYVGINLPLWILNGERDLSVGELVDIVRHSVVKMAHVDMASVRAEAAATTQHPILATPQIF